MKTLTNGSWRVGNHADSPVTGTVKIVLSQSDLSKVENGDVIVARQTDVNYTPQMMIASAIITVEGGRYSHAATFSRENNTPCIVGVIGIMDAVSDGDVITVDTMKKQIVIN